MPRLATLFAIFMLALTGTAFAQGAGDDQYQDPFGDEQSQDDGGSQDGGLSDEPPSSGGGSDSSSGSGSGGSGASGSGAGSGGGGTTPSTPSTTAPEATSGSGNALPRTGGDPLVVMGVGALMMLTGFGLRLRTIDPDAY